MLGQILNNRYKIIEKIGEGGMALVFSGHDQLLEREVAIKILRPQFVADENFIRMFKREARAAASLNHLRIVNVYDIGQDGDIHYLVMENIKGVNLKKYIKQGGPSSLTESLIIIKEITEALDIAHRNNLVHCDIKPHNIILTQENGIKVTDFGIARAMSSAITLTNTKSIMGSAYYISPEQAKGDQITPSSDIYSLGVVAYELITGCLPFRDENPISTALKHIRDIPEPPSRYYQGLPSYIEQIILKAMEKNPKDRYKDAYTLLQEINSALHLLKMESPDELADEKRYILNQEEDLPVQDDLPIESDANETIILEKESLTKTISLSGPLPIPDRSEPDGEMTRVSSSSEQIDNEDSYFEEDGNEFDSEDKLKFLQILVKNKYYILMALIAISVIVGMWGGYKSYMNVPIVVVPDLKGYTLEEVQIELKKFNLSYMVSGDQYHDEIPKGAVVGQYPEQLEEIRAGRKVTLILSSGPLWTETPSLERLTLREAEVILGAAGLHLGEITYEHNEELEKDKIISQEPSAGQEIKPKTVVNIVVSKGSVAHIIKVPNLLGLTIAEAEETLIAFDLELGTVTTGESLRYLNGQISGQEPKMDTPAAENTKVNIVVSTGIINKEAAPVYPLNIRVPVPAGRAKQEVKIVVIDNNGENTVYKEIHEPGDRVFQRINTVGPTLVKILINNILAREEKFGF